MTERQIAAECGNGHSRSEFGYIAVSGRWRCRKCNSNNTMKSNRTEAGKARTRRRTNKHNRLAREMVLAAYGGTCTCCGENREPFLVIDHIEGDGAVHRAQIRKGTRWAAGAWTYRWLIENGYPEGFQVLCANCNMAKDRPGGCPHAAE